MRVRKLCILSAYSPTTQNETTRYRRMRLRLLAHSLTALSELKPRISQKIIIQNEKKFRFFLSRIYGMDYDKKTSHATVPLSPLMASTSTLTASTNSLMASITFLMASIIFLMASLITLTASASNNHYQNPSTSPLTPLQ
jgi:hypothetical protein